MRGCWETSMLQLTSMASDESAALRAVCLLALSLLVAYRYIFDSSFKDRPHPNSPPIVQSSIPWWGHAYAFLFHRSDVLRECRAKYGPVYKLAVTGRYFIVVSSPASIADVVGKSPNIMFSLNDRAVRTMTGLPPSRVQHIASVLQYQIFGIIASKMSKRSMGTFFTSLSQDISVRLNAIASGAQSFHIPLTDLVAENVFRASAQAFFGPSVPDIYHLFLELDRQVYYVIHSVPFFGRKSYRAVEHLATALTPYVQRAFDGGRDIYIEGASIPILESLHELHDAGVSPAEIARVLITVVWGFHSNIIHTISSSCAFLGSDPITCARITGHLRTVIQSRWGDLDAFLKEEPRILDDPDFEILDSIFQETLRMSSIASSARNVLQDTTIRGDGGETYFLKQGECVLADVAGMHYDPDLYADPHTFKADRFLNRKDPSMAKYTARGIKHLVPWGGGTFICKGRDHAEYMFKIFLIQCLVKYDISFPVGFQPSFCPNTSVTVARLDNNPIVHCQMIGL